VTIFPPRVLIIYGVLRCVTVLGPCLTDEIMSSTRIKHNEDGVSFQGKHISEDLLTLGSILHSSVVDVTDLCNGNFLIS
jgi:hypothetical protein